MKSKLEIIIDLISREYAPVCFTLLVTVILTRLSELILLIHSHGARFLTPGDIILAIISDLFFVVVTSLPMTAIATLIKRAGEGYGRSAISILASVTGIAGFLLSFYYVSTLVPLGPEFWAYSPREMLDTAVAAESYLALKLLGILTVAMLFGWMLTRFLNSFENLSLDTRLGVTVSLILITLLGGVAANSLQPDDDNSFVQNKITHFVMSISFDSEAVVDDYDSVTNSEYPFMKKADGSNVLGPFFENMNQPPNIVFILIESLGGEFVGNSGQWGGFAPFVDSLAKNGLYWENGLSMSGRTFGMIPTLLGSLPPGKNGFMDLGPDYPSHTSIIQLLSDAGYHTSFYSGYNTYFDGLNYFLNYQGTDLIISKEWIEENVNGTIEKSSSYWGYDDKTMFDITSTIADTLKHSPRLEIYHTLQSHSPFTVPDEAAYADRFDDHLDSLPVSESKRMAFNRYRDEFTTLLFTDDAVREFMSGYRKRDDYANTIFIITGDHWLIPVPQTSQISRYHVPLIFYSEMIKKPVLFESVNSHFNVVPALTSLLENSAGLSLPDSVHWVGGTMDTTRTFRNIHSLPMMKNKNQLSDFIAGDFFISDDRLFKLDKNLKLTETDNPAKAGELKNSLAIFRSENAYATLTDKLYPIKTEPESDSSYGFITEFASLFDEIDGGGMSIDEQFQLARQHAFAGSYDKARAIAKRLLLEVPSYHDVRLLLGRTHAWDGNYDKAAEHFLQVVRRDPNYHDTYNAHFDSEYWSGDYESALEIIDSGLTYHPSRSDFMSRKIKVLMALDRKNEARLIVAALKKHDPSHKDLSNYEHQLSQ